MVIIETVPVGKFSVFQVHWDVNDSLQLSPDMFLALNAAMILTTAPVTPLTVATAV
jgi:hypothetical protein